MVDAIANWPLTHMKNPIIYNQTPKFKDLTFKIPISVQYKKSPASSFSKSHPPLLHHHSSTTIILHRPTQDPPINLCPGDDCRLRWLRRTIQLRRHLVASRLGNDGHTSTKKSSLSLKTRVNKKHLRATMLVVVQTIPRPCHEQALRASDWWPSHLVENQAGASWDDVWYVGLPYIIVLLIHGHRSASVRGLNKNISFEQRSSVLLQSSWKLAESREAIYLHAGIENWAPNSK